MQRQALSQTFSFLEKKTETVNKLIQSYGGRFLSDSVIYSLTPDNSNLLGKSKTGVTKQ